MRRGGCEHETAPSLVRARWSSHFVSARCRCQSGRHRVWLWGKTRRGGEAARAAARGRPARRAGGRPRCGSEVGAAALVVERRLRLQAVPPVDHAVVAAVEGGVVYGGRRTADLVAGREALAAAEAGAGAARAPPPPP